MVVNIKRNIFLIRWRIPGMNHFIVCCKIKFSHEENKNNEKYSDSYYRVLKLRRNTVSCLHRYYTFPSVNDKKFVNDRFSILSFFFFFFYKYKYIDRSICKQWWNNLRLSRSDEIERCKTAVIFLDVKRRERLDFINYPSVKTILDRANV